MIRFVFVYDPDLANATADMTAWRLLDQLAPCRYCDHAQQDHDEDNERCNHPGCCCSTFQYREDEHG